MIYAEWLENGQLYQGTFDTWDRFHELFFSPSREVIRAYDTAVNRRRETRMIDIEVEYSYHSYQGEYYDFLLRDGTRLHPSEWNGEVYTVKTKDGETTFRPVYQEISPDEYKIIGFHTY